MALAGGAVVAILPQGLQPVHAGQGPVPGRRQVFEGEGGWGPGEAGEDLPLQALHVDLDEVRHAEAPDQLVQGRHPDLPGLTPAHAAKVGPLANLLGPGGGEGGDGGVAIAHPEGRLPRPGADRLRDQGHRRVAAVEQGQDPQQVRLGLHRDDPGAQGAPALHPIAHMGTDVEAQGVGPQEGGVEAGKPPVAQGIAVVEAQGTGQAEGAGDAVVTGGHGCSREMAGAGRRRGMEVGEACASPAFKRRGSSDYSKDGVKGESARLKCDIQGVPRPATRRPGKPKTRVCWV